MSKLTDELRDFFIPHAITETVGLKIFTKWLIEKSGLEGTKPFYFSRDELKIGVGIIDLSQLEKLLNFFEIEKANYKTNSYLPLNADVIFNVVLPQFKEEVTDWAQTSKKLRRYQVKSQHELGETARRKISYLTQNLLSDLNPEENAPNELDKELSLILLAVQATTEMISRNNRYSDYLLDLHATLFQFYEENPMYHKNLELNNILYNFEEYEKFNRVDVLRLVEGFKKDLELFCLKYQISAGQCDIFEHVLFQMAGISQMPQKSNCDTSYPDQTRITFRITEMPNKELDLFKALFLKYKDDTVRDHDPNKAYEKR
jgi:hypothetical protein